jgi:hypothetical protein
MIWNGVRAEHTWEHPRVTPGAEEGQEGNREWTRMDAN